MPRSRAPTDDREPWALEDAAIDPASKWQARPILAFLLRAVSFLLPIAASVGTSILMVRMLPLPRTLLQAVGWYFTVLASTSAVLF